MASSSPDKIQVDVRNARLSRKRVDGLCAVVMRKGKTGVRKDHACGKTVRKACASEDHGVRTNEVRASIIFEHSEATMEPVIRFVEGKLTIAPAFRWDRGHSGRVGTVSGRAS